MTQPTVNDIIDSAQCACIARLQDFGLPIEHLDHSGLREAIFLLVSAAQAEPPRLSLEARAAALASDIIGYCDIKSLSLGGLVDQLKEHGLTPRVARDLTSYCDRVCLTLDGLVDKLWELRSEWHQRALSEEPRNAQ